MNNEKSTKEGINTAPTDLASPDGNSNNQLLSSPLGQKSKPWLVFLVLLLVIAGIGIIFWKKGNFDATRTESEVTREDQSTFDGRISFHTNQLLSLEDFSKRRAYVNPKILTDQAGVVMPGLPEEYRKPDNIERSFQDNVWHDSEESSLPEHHQRYNDFLELSKKLEQASSLRIGQKTVTGTRTIVNTIESGDGKFVLVQVGEEHVDPELEEQGGYPFGVPFTLAEDYECNVETLRCTETDVIKKADAYMATRDVDSVTRLVYSFWHFWNRESNSLIGYRSGEGAGPDLIYMYYPSRREYVTVGGENTSSLDFSPSMQRMMIIDSVGIITTYDIRNNFTQIQKADSSNLKEFFETPYSDYNASLPQYRKIWSEDEPVVYFVDPRQGQSSEIRIFSHNVTTGVTERLIDATSLHDLPKAHAQSIAKEGLFAVGPELSRSGRYLHYYLSPSDQSKQDTHVIIDLLNQTERKELVADKPKYN